MNHAPFVTALRRIGRGLIALLLAAGQCATPAYAQTALPALGDGVDMSTSAERHLGDQIARALYRSPDYVDDPVLLEYVQGIWQRLMAAARQRGDLPPELDERFAWQVLLIRDRSANAFALPGGYMGVHLGLIGMVDNEDELASVLAHELSHVTQRHIARLVGRQEHQAPWLLGALILGALAASANPSAASAVIAGGQAAAAQGQLNFSRDMEREADRIGYGVLTQAGYDPHAFVTMFEKLQQASRLNDSGAFPYLRTHPLTTERIAAMAARQQLSAQGPAAHRTAAHAMLAARARVLANPQVDSLRAAVERARAQDLAALSPAQQAGALYGGALAAIQLREFDASMHLLERLRRLTGADPAADRLGRLLAAELAFAQGQYAQVIELLAQGAATVGHSRPALLLAARAWTRAGQPRRAAEPLQVWLSDHPRDAQAWQLLSAAYEAQGETVRAVRADAEARAAELDYEAALARMRAAQQLTRRDAAVDHIDASIIDTRVREIESLVREQTLER